MFLLHHLFQLPHIPPADHPCSHIANALNGPLTCLMGQASNLTYKDDMDDFRVYSRELSAGDICTLYTN